MVGRRGLLAVLAGFVLTSMSDSAARGGTIQDILDSGGSTTVGALKFTFTKDSASGTGQNGALTVKDVTVESVAGGLTFAASPFLDLKSQTVASLDLTLLFTVTALDSGRISGSTLSFKPGLVETGGMSEVDTTFTDRNETLRVFKSNNNETITQKLTNSVTFDDRPNSLSVKDVAKLSLTVAQGNQRTIQLQDLTNTFTVVPEPSTWGLAMIAGLVGLGFL